MSADAFTPALHGVHLRADAPGSRQGDRDDGPARRRHGLRHAACRWSSTVKGRDAAGRSPVGEGFSLSGHQRPARAPERCRPTRTWKWGDIIGFGISHPCTTFDKWQVLFVVDDEYGVVDAIRTFF
jgi:D-serine deaminase-like pyridoxal phosphate-dependent protein